MNKVDTKVTGDATVGVQFLADQCKASGVASIWVGISLVIFKRLVSSSQVLLFEKDYF